MSAEVRVAGRTFTATTRNLSVGGCCLEAAHAMPEDAAIELDLFVVVDDVEEERLPPLSVRGTVMWVAETGEIAHVAGVRFEGMTAAQGRWLEQFLAQAQPGGV
jgi:hypothetical protein